MRPPCPRVQGIDREIAMDESQLVAVAGEKLDEGFLEPLAEGAAEVLELNDRHRRCCGSLEGSARHAHLGPEGRPSLEVNHHTGLGSEGFKESFPPGRQLL